MSSHTDHLILCGCTAVCDQNTVDLSCLTGLTHLDLSSTHLSDTGLSRCLEALTNLVSLEVQGCPGLKGRALRHVENTKTLRRVNLGINLDLKERSLRHLKQLPDIQSLSLNFCLNIGDYALTHHISALVPLTYLDLGACVVCTDLGLQRMSTLTSLKVLKLSHLPNVRGPGLSALEYMPDLQVRVCMHVLHSHSILCPFQDATHESKAIPSPPLSPLYSRSSTWAAARASS